MEINKKTLRTILWGAAGCIFLYWLLHETERLGIFLSGLWKIASPFVIGAILAFILNVPMRSIEKGLKFVKKPGLRRGLAMLLTVLAVALVLTGVIYLLIPQLITTIESLIATLPGFFNRLYEQTNAYLMSNPELMEWLSENTDFASINWPDLIQKAVGWVSNSLSSIVDTAITTVINLGTGVFNGILSLVFAFYCLGRKEILARQFRRVAYAFLPEHTADFLVRVMRMSNLTFSNFISGQCLEALILGAMFAVCMPIFKMPYVPLVSAVITVTALVPIVGAFAGCVIGAFFILVQNPMMALWFIVLFLVLQQIEGNLIYPKVVGTSIGLPGMWVLVAIAFGGDLMGVAGMLLMIPLVSVLYALLREFTAKRLAKRGIAKRKLQDQPMVLRSGFKQQRINNRELKRKLNKLRKKAAADAEESQKPEEENKEES